MVCLPSCRVRGPLCRPALPAVLSAGWTAARGRYRYMASLRRTNAALGNANTHFCGGAWLGAGLWGAAASQAACGRLVSSQLVQLTSAVCWLAGTWRRPLS